MSEPAVALLHDVLAEHLASLIENAEPGHCVRVDDVSDPVAADLTERVRTLVPNAWTNVLRASPIDSVDIPPERAIEYRNRKARACLLLVPAGEGHAASSLDNAYQRLPMLDIYAEAARTLDARLTDAELREAIRPLRRHFAKQNREAWAEYVAELVSNPSLETYGRELWRLGLVPDLGPDPQERVERNRVVARSISRPGRPAASIDERLTAAGLGEGAWRGLLRRFLDERGAELANPRTWTGDIAKSRPDFFFHEWKLVESLSEGDLRSVEVEPFTRPDGTINKACKLSLGADGQLILEVPEDGSASMVVHWETDPPQVQAVAKWRLEILPPDDLRTAESEAVHSVLVAGDKRRATLKVAVDSEALLGGSRFVVVVSAVGEFGEAARARIGRAGRR